MAKLISIKINTEIKPLYDIEVKDNNNFVANNIVIHNSEQYLSRDSLCVLASINCGGFSTNPEVYVKELEKIGKSINRFLDNVNECELVYQTYATPHQKLSIQKLRRTGAGVTNIAAWLFKQNLAYGTPEANNAFEEFIKLYNYWLYISSEEIGKEKGCFGLFNSKKWKDALFVSRVIEESRKISDKYKTPILTGNYARNVTCSSIAPTGCCIKDTKILTDIGELSLEDIFIKNGIDISELEKNNDKKWIIPNNEIKVKNLDGSYQKITKLYYNGRSVIKKIITENGHEISATIDSHKILVKSKTNPGYGEWKFLNDITEEDEIIIENIP